MLWRSEQNWKEIERLTKSLSDELYSEKFYKELDGLREFKVYIPYCNSLNSLPKHQSLKITCAKILKYLKTNKFSKKEDNEYDTCILLNYWLYNRLNVILQSDNFYNIYRAFGDIGYIWSNFIANNLEDVENETCEHVSNIVSHLDWRKEKELYDYCVNYDALKKVVLRYPQICNDVHEYIEDKAYLYEHFKKHCTSSDENVCPKFYEKCKMYDPKDVLPLPGCHERIKRERSADVPKLPRADETDSGKETQGNFPPESSYAVGKFGDVFLGVVATTMTAGGLYKFTPVGRMLRNGFGWNNSNMSNLNGVDNGLYGYASEAFNPYSGEEHYIGYHPA
ncbi:unnamed protein product [Plasmodium vivax]|uniref:(malaria parasite P. vivax) hypothetical protein n=1 Tax=Plasmodium vivax TaxID=5855 RepID=A0A565A4T5_PLAVI|nr:unnamed protein product [Plasmodium vivax]VUZ99527.1 PIR protein [Plasmodium vivax]